MSHPPWLKAFFGIKHSYSSNYGSKYSEQTTPRAALGQHRAAGGNRSRFLGEVSTFSRSVVSGRASSRGDNRSVGDDERSASSTRRGGHATGNGGTANLGVSAGLQLDHFFFAIEVSFTFECLVACRVRPFRNTISFLLFIVIALYLSTFFVRPRGRRQGCHRIDGGDGGARAGAISRQWGPPSSSAPAVTLRPTGLADK